MISVEKAKKILNDSTLSEKEITEIRDNLRFLAEIIFEKWQNEKEIKKVNQIKN